LTNRSFKRKMSPKTANQNEIIRQQSTKKILEAAFVLFARKGYESTSIAQISKEAGVSKGLLYNYFQSKEDLLTTLVNNAINEGDHLMGEIVNDNPSDTLRNLFEWFFNDLSNRPDHWKLITELTFKIDKFQFVHDIFTQKMNEYVAFIENILAQMAYENPREEARLITSMFDGIGIQYLVIREDYPLEEIKEFLIKKYCEQKN